MAEKEDNENTRNTSEHANNVTEICVAMSNLNGSFIHQDILRLAMRRLPNESSLRVRDWVCVRALLLSIILQLRKSLSVSNLFPWPPIL